METDITDMEHGNIYAEIPENLDNEVFDSLVQSRTVKIERIVSKGHVSPDAGWYDQERNEWVIVLKGRASILFASEPVAVDLEEGGYVNIPAHKKHRVVSTSAAPETVWLAVHY